MLVGTMEVSKLVQHQGWYFADLIANESPHSYVQNHNLERFEKGINIDERGAGPDPKLHG